MMVAEVYLRLLLGEATMPELVASMAPMLMKEDGVRDVRRTLAVVRNSLVDALKDKTPCAVDEPVSKARHVMRKFQHLPPLNSDEERAMGENASKVNQPARDKTRCTLSMAELTLPGTPHVMMRGKKLQSLKLLRSLAPRHCDVGPPLPPSPTDVADDEVMRTLRLAVLRSTARLVQRVSTLDKEDALLLRREHLKRTQLRRQKTGEADKTNRDLEKLLEKCKEGEGLVLVGEVLVCARMGPQFEEALDLAPVDVVVKEVAEEEAEEEQK